MCSMCQYCGIVLAESKASNTKLDNEMALKSDNKFLIRPCKFCGEKLMQEHMKWDSLSPCGSPVISPTTSLSSSDDGSAYSYSEFSVDMNSSDRSLQVEGDTNGGIDNVDYKLNGQSQNTSQKYPQSWIEKSDKVECHIVRDTDNAQGHNEEIEYSLSDDLNPQTWQPPDPENPQDDVVNSVVSNDDDDDDEGIDSDNWSEQTSLSHSTDDVSGCHRFKEEKQRAMKAVINDKFKTIVGQLLKSVSDSYSNEWDKNWVDIVTSLSWEAASFLNTDAIGDNAINPERCVKIKCIASGSPRQSQLIRGLVFKKHAAHKHMPTKYKNARLLLVKGMLGHSCSGLSSFDSFDQELSYLKSTIELIEMCQPNVILVERTVPRDMIEATLVKGMIMVHDMKLHRLERVARCTGSPVLSCDDLNGQNLKHCKSIYFEKFVEEHDGFGGGGKRPIRTLMFIEGCPTRLGCTILLKGTRSDELKRIKSVLRRAVVTAYHLILETSFLADQRAMFSTIHNVMDIFPTIHQSQNSSVRDSSNPSLKYYSDSKKVIGDSFPFRSSDPHESLSTFLGFNGMEQDDQVKSLISISNISEANEHCRFEAKIHSDEDKCIVGRQSLSLPVYLESNWDIFEESGNDIIQSKDDVNTVLDSQSILVLMSSWNALRESICQQSHYSRIIFYKNFDVPLGKFLQDNLLNQTKLCGTCHGLPDAHFYYYAHNNKQLTIQVKQLPQGKHLTGEAEGKLWMWSRCGKCHSGLTKRVLISTTAQSLSFGKFLELKLSHYSSSRTKSSCGHSPDKDFLYFFGSGHMVAIFRYSSVTTYNVSMPPKKMEFSDEIKQEWLLKERENVYMKGTSLFTEVENSLRTIKLQMDKSILNLGGSIGDFSKVEEMLKQERVDFEVNIKNAVTNNGILDQVALKYLRLNRLMWDILIEFCVWDRRLYSLLSPDCLRVYSEVAERLMQDSSYSKLEGNLDRESCSMNKCVEDGNTNGKANVKVSSDRFVEVNELPMKVITINGPLLVSNDEEDPSNTFDAQRNLQKPIVSNFPLKRSSEQEINLRQDVFIQCLAGEGNLWEKDFISLNIPLNDSKVLYKSYLMNSPVSTLQDPNEWFWKPFSDIRQTDVQDLQEMYMSKVESQSRYFTDTLSASRKLIIEECLRLHIPLRTYNHIVSDYEGELSSIIACALALLKDSNVVAEVDDENNIGQCEIKTSHDLSQSDTITSLHMFLSDSSDSDSVNSTGSSSAEESQVSQAPANHSIEISFGYAKSLGKEKYQVICQYDNQFRELRNWCCLSELDYIASLSRCRNWDAKGGKSRSLFAKTLDDRFIIKEIKKTELDSFLGFAPLYFKYLKESLESGSQTCLAKVLGIYQVTKRHTKSGKEDKHDLLVMENILYNRYITRKYDLKGALYDRYNSAVDGAGDVLLDQNFVNDINSSPLYISSTAKCHLQRAVWNDTMFLNSINVMDYSLFVGVDSQRREFVCGIIDYLRQYTWDKHLETWMKSSLVVPKNVLPTVISPKEYKKRFRKFMSTHFLSVPNSWCCKKSTDPC